MQRLKGNALPSCRAEGGASHGALGQRRPLIRPDRLRGRRTKRPGWIEEGATSEWLTKD